MTEEPEASETEDGRKADDDREAKRRRSIDVELKAIDNTLAILEELTPTARRRAIAYLLCRFQEEQA